MPSKLLEKSDIEARPWCHFFSSLAAAEKAAGLQAVWIANQFALPGRQTQADLYNQIALEEELHGQLVASLCPLELPAPAAAERVYAGGRCLTRGDAQLVERLALIHLVFEPAALAILGFLHKHAGDLFEQFWAADVNAACAKILSDEVRHVRDGRALTRAAAMCLEPGDVSLIRRSLELHRAFVVGGIRRFFASRPEQGHALMARFIFAYNHASLEVFRGKP